jgi:hypothetical protein
MYTQALDVQGLEPAAPMDAGSLEQRFLERVDAEDVVIASQSGAPIAHFRGRCARLRLPPASSTTGWTR